MATNDKNEDNSYDSVYAGITLNSLFGDSDISDYPLPNFINIKNKQSEKNLNSSECCFDLHNSNNMLLGLDLLEGEKTEKEGGEKEITKWDQFDNASAAFLGPQLWEKTIPCNSDLKLEYMNLDEFLNENNIDEELIQRRSVSEDRASVISGEEKSPISVPPCAVPSLPKATPDQSFLPEVAFKDPSSQSPSTPPSTSGKAGPITEYASSPSPVAGPRSPQGPDSPGYSLPDDEVLASVPGEDFDPRIRPFSEDELKPQPMIKKSRKQYVPTDLKDDRYWARRRKNNVAAKRSRDARRTKENQIAMRASFLEKENQNLRIELEKTRTILDSMKKRLSAYETA